MVGVNWLLLLPLQRYYCGDVRDAIEIGIITRHDDHHRIQ